MFIPKAAVFPTPIRPQYFQSAGCSLSDGHLARKRRLLWTVENLSTAYGQTGHFFPCIFVISPSTPIHNEYPLWTALRADPLHVVLAAAHQHKILCAGCAAIPLADTSLVAASLASSPSLDFSGLPVRLFRVSRSACSANSNLVRQTACVGPPLAPFSTHSCAPHGAEVSQCVSIAASPSA
jgi:hypothetical protein